MDLDVPISFTEEPRIDTKDSISSELGCKLELVDERSIVINDFSDLCVQAEPAVIEPQIAPPFECSTCGFKCSCTLQLRSHLKSHAEEPKKEIRKTEGHFRCEVCDYVTKYRTSLTNHMVRHSDAKPFQCSKCDYKCKLKFYLNCHMRTHTGERPYKCKVCDFQCAQKTVLVQHARMHKGEQFTCRLCPFKSLSKAKLNQHVRRHTEPKS